LETSYQYLNLDQGAEELKINNHNYVYYRYKTISIDHLKELQEDIDGLRRENKLSTNETYQSYINELNFDIPEELSDAKSVIVVAMFTRLLKANFHLNGNLHEVMLPPGYYYVDGYTPDSLIEEIQKKIIKVPGFKLEKATKVHIKLLAVRSGLGKYGRNNICYVDGMGSFITLFAYFTDYQFKEDDWTKKRLIEKCEGCKICMNNCPGKAITEDNFVINVGKCITLYNEVEGDFPEWIKSDEHNALLGCMRCQLRCPENKNVIKLTGKREEIAESITRKIIEEKTDNDVLEALCKQLRMSKDPELLKGYFSVISRNLKVLIAKPNQKD
jgi:epoxyqueuosine reductase